MQQTNIRSRWEGVGDDVMTLAGCNSTRDPLLQIFGDEAHDAPGLPCGHTVDASKAWQLGAARLGVVASHPFEHVGAER
jgi:hypothetical protein